AENAQRALAVLLAEIGIEQRPAAGEHHPPPLAEQGLVLGSAAGIDRAVGDLAEPPEERDREAATALDRGPREELVEQHPLGAPRQVAPPLPLAPAPEQAQPPRAAAQQAAIDLLRP